MDFDVEYIRARLTALSDSRWFDYSTGALRTEDEIGASRTAGNGNRHYAIFAKSQIDSMVAALTLSYLRYCEDTKSDPDKHIDIVRKEIERFYSSVRDRFTAYAKNYNPPESLRRSFDEHLVQCRKDFEGALKDASVGRLHDQQIYQQIQVRSAQGFVAMWFSPGTREIYEKGIAPAIVAAGYDPLRIDRHEHINRIDDEILAQIRRSKFVVADFTGHRHGVYFEAGFALGLGMPVIWSCKKSEMSNLHFDIAHYNCLDWDASSELLTRLQKRIEALIGKGPRAI